MQENFNLVLKNLEPRYNFECTNSKNVYNSCTSYNLPSAGIDIKVCSVLLLASLVSIFIIVFGCVEQLVVFLGSLFVSAILNRYFLRQRL